MAKRRMGGAVLYETSPTGPVTDRPNLTVILDPKHVVFGDFVERMRAMDYLEATSMYPGIPVEKILQTGLENNDETIAVFVSDPDGDERLIAFGGVASRGDAYFAACPWLLLTDEVLDDWKREFIIVTGTLNRKWQKTYPVLFNAVHAENDTTISWLKRMGYTVRDEIHTISGEPFREFIYVQSNSIH